MTMERNNDRRHPAALVFDEVHATGAPKKGSKRTPPPRVTGISAVISSGESVGILGDASDGVAVLMQTAAGIIKPKSGAVYVRSQPAQINATTAFSLDVTLRANVERAAMSLDLNGARLKMAVRRILARLELEAQENELCVDIDPLDVERARLAATLMAAPSLMLIDEPPLKGRALMDARAEEDLDRFLRTGGSLIVAGREPTVMRRVCQRILWMKQGEILMDSTAAVVARDFARLDEAKDDRIKTAQMRRRFASDYSGVKVVTQNPDHR